MGSSDEDRNERLDRELIEFLNELRVAIPGIQVLFPFLLTVPFTQRFDTVTEFQEEYTYYVVVAASAGIALVFAWFWYGLPLSRRAQD